MKLLFIMIAAFLVCFEPAAEAKIRKPVQRHQRVPVPTLQQEQMLNDLGFIQNVFQVAYAPLEWKRQQLGWNLEKQITEAKRKVRQKRTMTVREYQGIIKDFCQSVKDYHVYPTFFSTESAELPFDIKSAEGKYYITWIEAKEAGEQPIPLSVGDEVISIDGQPIGEAVEAFRKREYSHNYAGTDQAFAELFFTQRKGKLGHEVPEGTVLLMIKPAGTDQSVTVEVAWEYQPEIISSAFLAGALKAVQPLQHNQKRNWDHFYHSDEAENESSIIQGAKRGFLPPLGEILWEADEESCFQAYIFQMPGGKKGAYVRIPSYSIQPEKGVSKFAEIIRIFEEQSDVLVIDQMNNFGGKIFYMYALLAMLTDRPLEVPKHRDKITHADIYSASGYVYRLDGVDSDEEIRKILGNTFDGYPIDQAFAKGLVDFQSRLIDQWNAGKLFTDLDYRMGVDYIHPHPRVHYTKPILVLVNSLDMSGGDFFPAILQDNGRATIMGTRTAGAGGRIERISFPNLSGIQEIAVTASFAVRPNGQPIENLGVTPDIPYEVSALDLQHHYVEYTSRILEEMEKLISSS